MSFKQFLLEFNNVDASKLTETPEFKKFEAADPDFAKKLASAWKGDIAEYARNKDKFDPLFTKMLTPEALQKFSPKSSSLKQEASKLIQLHKTMFKTTLHDYSKKVAGDKWGNQDYGTHKRSAA